MNDDEPRRIDHFDRIIGSVDGRQDVVSARPSTVTTVMPIIGRSQTYVVQTYKDPDVGNFLFLQMVDAEQGIRIAIPPKVTAAIYRQRDALVKASRRQTGRDRWANMTSQQRRAATDRLAAARKPRAVKSVKSEPVTTESQMAVNGLRKPKMEA